MFWLPIIAGATIGALTNKDPIKGAVIGGTLGAAGGATLGAGAAGGAGASATGLLGSAAGAGTAGAGATGLIGAQSVAPAVSAGVTGKAAATTANFMPSTGAQTGMFNTFNTATNAPMGNPAASIVGSTGQMAPNMGIVNPMTQGVQDYSPLMTREGASAGGLSVDPAASRFSRFLDGLPDYVTPENVLGAADILSQSQPQQMPMPTSSASVSRGTPRQGAIDYGMAQPIKRRGLL